MFTSILNSVEGTLTIQNALICTAVSLVMGLIIAFVYMKQGPYTKNFVITLAILPVLVQMVIMLVNGNVGTGVAVLGTFSLIRFRSVPGTARDIVSIFFSMAVGLATGMGYLSFAAVMTIVAGAAFFLMFKSPMGEPKSADKDLRVTIPEDLDYTDIFDDIFDTYTSKCTLMQVKTSNMGSLYELTYKITLQDEKKEKEMIDAIRVRNGNLKIVCGRISKAPIEL